MNSHFHYNDFFPHYISTRTVHKFNNYVENFPLGTRRVFVSIVTLYTIAIVISILHNHNDDGTTYFQDNIYNYTTALK